MLSPGESMAILTLLPVLTDICALTDSFTGVMGLTAPTSLVRGLTYVTVKVLYIEVSTHFL